MRLDRRSFLGALLAAGGSIPLGASWTWASPGRTPAARHILLLPQTAAAAAILRGAQAACAERGCGEPDIVALPQEGFVGDALFARRPQATWVAVLPEADAILLLEAARSAGKPLLWMGSHVRVRDGAQLQRHTLSVSSARHSPRPFLAAQLDQLGERHTLEETLFPGAGASPAARAVGASTWRAGNWLEALGHALTLAALGEAPEAPALRAAPAASAGTGSDAPPGHFLSLALGP